MAVLKEMATNPAYLSTNREAIVSSCRPVLAKIVQVMGESKWIAGEDLCWVDFFFAELLEVLNALSEGSFYNEFPLMRTYWERFI